MKPLVIFDLDGVLVNSREGIAASLNYALSSGGFATRDDVAIHQLIGPPLHSVFATLTGLEVRDPALERCVTAYREHYRAGYLVATSLIDGMGDALRALRDRAMLSVATSKATTFVGPLLDHLNIADCFDVVEGADLDAADQPKSVTIGRVLRACGRPSSAAVMIGDTRYDVIGAREHGIPTIGVTWGIESGEELVASGAVAIADVPADLPDLALRVAKFMAKPPAGIPDREDVS